MTEPTSPQSPVTGVARNQWYLYTGSGEPAPVSPPESPPWRKFDQTAEPECESLTTDEDAGATFRPSMPMIEAVNAALHLRRPLLLTGRPGSGKSSLIEAVARELVLGRVLRWHVTSASTLSDALYRYDAIGRLHAQSLRDATARAGSPDPAGADVERSDHAPISPEPPQSELPKSTIEGYLRLGPLGTALLPSRQPRALLIDEIDKSDIDLPNDLLNVLERGEFVIPELARLDRATVTIRVDGGDETADVTRGRVRCREFPFVVLTSNGEREFPAAFLRRCIRLRMPDPSLDMLTEIVTAHLGPEVTSRSMALISQFAESAAGTAALSTDQLLNALFLIAKSPASADLVADPDARAEVEALLLKKLTADLL